MTSKALLIDLDGVLRHWPESDEPIEADHGIPAGSIRRAAFLPQNLLPAIMGEISDAEWRLRIAECLRRELGTSSAAEAVARWSAHPGLVDQRTLAILEQCRSTLKVVLVTNATSRLPSDLAVLGLADRFFGIVNSSEARVAKPSPAMFHLALRRADVTPEEALFVDDTAANVEAASALGIRSHHFVGHEQLASFLKQAGAFKEPAL